MRILILSPYIPWPLHGGSSVRMFNIIKELSKQGHRIVLVVGQYDTSPLQFFMGNCLWFSRRLSGHYWKMEISGSGNIKTEKEKIDIG